MAKKRQEPTEFSGWTEERTTSTKQVIKPDGTEDLDRRFEHIERRFFGRWTRTEDGEYIIRAEITKMQTFYQTDVYKVFVHDIAGRGTLGSTNFTNSIESAKSQALHRAKKLVENFPVLLEVPETEEE